MENNAKAITEMFETVSLGSPQNAVGFVLWRVMHRFQREADRVLKPHDLTHLQFTTLALAAWMSRDNRPVTQSELARFGDIHPMQVSNVIKALDGKAMVARTRAPGNALAKHVAITETGLNALRVTLPLMIELQQAMFGAEGTPGGGLLETLVRISQIGQPARDEETR